MNDVQVAGKTGTAQAMLNGQKDTIAWFCCFAPYDHPRYAIAVMVQGGEHGGSVAGPIATRILERTLAMDAGTFQPQLAWVAPAHKDDPFKMIPAVVFKDTLADVKVSDEEGANDSQTAEKADMAQPGDAPDVEPEADARGKVKNVTRPKRVLRAQPIAPATAQPTPKPRNFFQRVFGGGRPGPAPTPKPVRRAQPAP
jgi:penicillin-binding protein 2